MRNKNLRIESKFTEVSRLKFSKNIEFKDLE